MKTLYLALIIVVIFSSNLSMVGVDRSRVSSSDSISLTIDFGNDTILVLSDLTGTDVYNVTASVVDVEADWYGDLAYIHTIDGVTNDVQQDLYWQYWVDGEYASLAANAYTLSGTENIEWKRVSSQFTSNSSTQDDTLLLGFIGIGGFGVVFLLLLYWLGIRRNQ